MFEPDTTKREHRVVYIANGAFFKLVSGIVGTLFTAGVIAIVVMFGKQHTILTKLDNVQSAQIEAFSWRDDRFNTLASNFYTYERESREDLADLRIIVQSNWRNRNVQ